MKRGAILSLILTLAAPAAAQLAVPSLGPVVGSVRDTLGTATDVARPIQDLAQIRLDRLTAIVRDNRASVERDETGYPARRGEILLIDPDATSLAAARRAGFELIENGAIDGVDIAFARLSAPRGQSLGDAIRMLRKRLPGKEISADQLHLASGAVERGDNTPVRVPGGGTIGMIDGGIGGGVAVSEAKGFASGAPSPSAHGTAIASLLASAGTHRVVAADVYGRDPAGGNALAIARALGWMTGLRVPVVTISLVGPTNPLLARTVAAAQARGTIVVAAVGNDGPAAPPAYPASYPGVIAVTGVDGRNRALIEAGRALHLDYAAPGAMRATGLNGKPVSVRGTSFAAPLAAARLAALYESASNRSALIARIDAEAVDLGPKGTDKQYGRGLLCGQCRR